MTEVLLSTALMVALVLALSLAVLGARRILAPAHPVTVTVNGTMSLPGATGDKLLQVLLAGGLPVPSPCGGKGTCGLCRVRLPEMTEPPLPTERARLGAEEVSDGFRLACQTVVRGALAVEVPQEFLTAETLDCEVVSNRMLAPLIAEVVLNLPKGAAFDLRPGAFVQVTAPPYGLELSRIAIDPEHAEVWQRFGWTRLRVACTKPVTRAYSLANTPADDGRIVLTVRLAVPPPGAPSGTPPGIVSSFLFAAAPGDAITVAGPYGDFGAQETRREMVFIGGGVGMAPLRAIIHDQLDRRATDRKISYWFGARGMADAFYIDEFRDLERRHPNFRFTLALSDPAPEDAGIESGFIHQVARSAYLEDHPAPEDCEYYLCGPPLMIHAVRAMLDDLGVEDDKIFFDDFGG